MNGSKQEIGWRPFWFLLRGYQILALGFALFLGVTRPAPKPQEAPIIGLVVILILLVFDMFARGTANDRGVTFTRYREEQFVPWREVEEVVWSPKSIRIKLRDRHFLRRYVQFPLKSSVRKGFAFAFGGEVEEPAFVEWLHGRGYLDDHKIRRHNRWTW